MAVNDVSVEGQTRLIPVKRWPEIHEWPSEAGLRHLRFFCESNGFKAAFVRVGRRVLIDERVFFECARNWQRGQKK